MISWYNTSNIRDLYDDETTLIARVSDTTANKELGGFRVTTTRRPREKRKFKLQLVSSDNSKIPSLQASRQSHFRYSISVMGDDPGNHVLLCPAWFLHDPLRHVVRVPVSSYSFRLIYKEHFTRTNTDNTVFFFDTLFISIITIICDFWDIGRVNGHPAGTSIGARCILGHCAYISHIRDQCVSSRPRDLR